jgi:hypothetical protein
MPALRLSRNFVCTAGAPVIHSVDPAIFQLRYFMRCTACGFCKDQCCAHGVDVDIGNARRLLALGAEFEARVTVPSSEWFTTQVEQDAEFPSGAHVRTRVQNGKCVFVNGHGRGCAIHSYCDDHGVDYHSFKPIVSTLFPLTFEQGVLQPSFEAIDGSLICLDNTATLYEGARSELQHYFGSEFVNELDTLKVGQCTG